MSQNATLLFFITVLIFYSISWIFFIKAIKKEDAETQSRYEEATKWYRSLSESEKAHIMDIMWETHPVIKDGRAGMISIYKFYTKKEE